MGLGYAEIELINTIDFGLSRRYKIAYCKPGAFGCCADDDEVMGCKTYHKLTYDTSNVSSNDFLNSFSFALL